MSASGSVTLFWIYIKYFLCADHSWTNHKATNRLFVKPYTVKLIFASPFFKYVDTILERMFSIIYVKIDYKGRWQSTNDKTCKLLKQICLLLLRMRKWDHSVGSCADIRSLVCIRRLMKLLYEIILNSIYWPNITVYCSALLLHILEASISYLGPVTRCPALT
jgi:hypothetical protein